MTKFLFLDCDSTLCAIEGVDELAALRGPEVQDKVISLTNEAMDGMVPIDEVFARRLNLIQPNRVMCEKVAQMYIEKLSPNAADTISLLKKSGWETIIISGGFTQVIKPVAEQLDIEKIFAVNLVFDEEGNYKTFDNQSPTARNGGKPDIIRDLLNNESATQSIMIGDGISDLETKTVVDLFIGFGGIVSRKKVREQATAFAMDFNELPKIITNHF